MFFSSRPKLHFFSFFLLLLVILSAFMINGVVQRHATYAAYASSPLTVYVGSNDNNVYAFNATNGVRYWSYPTAGGVQTKPAYANGMVYVGSNDGYIYVLNASSGALVWRYNTGTVEGSPVVSQGIVYVGSSDTCYFYALNAKTGKLIWRFAHDITSSGCDHPLGTPAVFHGIVYVGGFSDSMYALDAKTGAVIWQIQSNSYSSPVVVNGTLYTGTYALNASTGAILWHANIDSTYPFISNVPAVSNGMVYLSAVTASGGDLYAIDEKTGAIRWMVPGDFDFSSPYAYKGVVYIGSYDYYGSIQNALSALNARTGALIWLYQAGGPIVATPTIANGIIYFGSYDKNLYALYANNGTLLWRHKTGGVVYSPIMH